MRNQTAWVQAPRAAKGQDHLGTHAPCIALYSRLLPGITNVTPRARYFSLYTWFIWAFDQRYKKADAQTFEQLFRKADCLLTLIAERHARRSEGGAAKHNSAMVGITTLAPALDGLNGNQVLRLSDYSTREDIDLRYFQSRLGGLDQYYIGTLQDMGILDSGNDEWIRYTVQKGKILAESVDTYVNGNRFFETIENDRVSLKRLDELDTFCSCHLPISVRERTMLANILFETAGFAEGGGQRRLTLALTLSMIDAGRAANLGAASVDDFARAVYGRSFGSSHTWQIPSALESTANAWGIYVRNELLSLAAQAIFSVGLKQLRQCNVRFLSGSDFEGWISKSDFAKRVERRIGKSTFGAAVKKRQRNMVPVGHSDLADHEWARCRSMMSGYSSQQDAAADENVVTNALELLIGLAGRETPASAYAASPFAPDYLDPYPINLQSFSDAAAGVWADLTPSQLIGWLMNHWGIETHLLIALRKLRFSRQSTFRVRPTERGLNVEPEIPPPTQTNPRLGSALQILRDLAAIADKEDGSRLTEFGKRMLSEVVDG